MRVGVDVSPLRQTGAGTARHVNGLLGALAGRDEIDVKRLAFGGAGDSPPSRATRPGTSPACRSPPAASTSSTAPPSAGRSARRCRSRSRSTTSRSSAIPSSSRAGTGRAGASATARSRARRRASSRSRSSRSARRSAARRTGGPSPRDRQRDRRRLHTRRTGRRGRVRARSRTLEPRKNLRRVEEAARIAGRASRRRRAGLGRCLSASWLGAVSDEELARLYRGALCLVFPSLYEGFGLPVLEAMACGTPVVTTRDGATAEIAGDAAGSSTRSTSEAIAAGIARGDRTPRRAARAGLARARAYTGTALRTRRLPLEGDRVKLVAIDADVLGRRRTGDETYVAEPAARARAARSRIRPPLRRDHAPPGARPSRDRAGEALDLVAGAAHGSHAAASPAPARPDLGHFQYALPLRLPCPAVVTIHDLSFERDPR